MDARAGSSETLLTLLGYDIAYIYLLLYDVSISNKANNNSTSLVSLVSIPFQIGEYTLPDADKHRRTFTPL